MNLYRIEDGNKDTFYIVAEDFGMASETFNDSFTSSPATIELIEDSITIQGEEI